MQQLDANLSVEVYQEAVARHLPLQRLLRSPLAARLLQKQKPLPLEALLLSHLLGPLRL